MNITQNRGDGLKRKAFALVLAWSFTILSLLLNLNTGLNLFARSGSVLVLVSIAITYQLMATRNAYHTKQLDRYKVGDPVDFSKLHPSVFHHQLEKFALITAVIGTVIWGYGDLVFSH